MSAGVPVEGLPTALRLTARSLRIGRAYGISDDPLFVDEHLDTILMHQDDELLAALRSRCFSPLEGLSPPTRERLSRTLLSWLRQMGAVVAELHVHPQTAECVPRWIRPTSGSTSSSPSAGVRRPLPRTPGPRSDGRQVPAAPRRSDAAPSRNGAERPLMR